MTRNDGSAHVSWVVELELRVGALKEFLLLTTEMVSATLREPGALIYERSISLDETRIVVYERYADAGAAIRHLETFADRFGERFAALVDRRSFTVFGAVNDELKEHLSPLGATFATYLIGFARSGARSRRAPAQPSHRTHSNS
jgi:quinol monooxygenase YgiN